MSCSQVLGFEYIGFDNKQKHEVTDQESMWEGYDNQHEEGMQDAYDDQYEEGRHTGGL